ncbi:DUF3054 domain-containing protein [Corynebacterium appendicis]|uniref:DUF3054 domain-containing protein n=1 Tax=Corynebacterium appendicis TaxID=163202 RepID=UPI00223BB7AF|nr:DUF3054 domain-containing protein [Corynebacterium appendicis]MCT1683974.1 DUF3054 domain-containing protein [Corynebacterium appendicis]
MKISSPVAIALDTLSIAVFALLARIAHQTEEMPLNLTGWLSTLWPFLVGVALAWVIVTLARKGEGKGNGVFIWLITVATGLIIWGIRNQQLPHWSFIVVASVMSALLMLGWRGIARLIKR